MNSRALFAFAVCCAFPLTWPCRAGEQSSAPAPQQNSTPAQPVPEKPATGDEKTAAKPDAVPAAPAPVLGTASPSLLDQPGIGKGVTVMLPGSVKVILRSIPSGSFTMGSPQSQVGRGMDEQQVNVILTQDFWMGETEFTQEQWMAVMGKNPSEWPRQNLPVESVSWYDVQDCLKSLTTKAPLPAGWHWALPTEAQWEWACRAGTRTASAFGDTLESSQANFDGEHPYGTTKAGINRFGPTPVASFKPNLWGLYDMHGNVLEWCQDVYSTSLAGGTDPQGPAAGPRRVNRGGSWSVLGNLCLSSGRSWSRPREFGRTLGFRVVIVRTPPTQPERK